MKFQVWKFTSADDGKPHALSVMDGYSSEGEPIVMQEHSSTDFPLPAIELWVVKDPGTWVIVLPREW
jgi:hypothetical protein